MVRVAKVWFAAILLGGCSAITGNVTFETDTDAGPAMDASVDAGGPTDSGPPDAAPDPDGGTDAGPPVDAGPCNVGDPLCVGSDLGECGPSGELINVVESCLLGCHPTEQRCNLIDPSNGLAGQLDMAAMDGADLAATTDSYVFDTDSGVVTANGTSVSVPSTFFPAGPSRPVAVRVFRFQRLSAADTQIVGSAAAVLVASGPLLFPGGQIFLGQFGPTGAVPGAMPPGSPCDGADAADTSVRAGAGGGGASQEGAQGGDGGSNVGAAGGARSGNDAIEPLVGGCSGGRVVTACPAMSGGGAVQLVSAERVQMIGVVSAEGRSATSFGCGGGGGGSVLIEAPLVELGGTGFNARGGRGGCSAVVSGSSCPGAQGGAGGVDATTPPTAGASSAAGGGGGGGGVGRVRINTADGNYMGTIFQLEPEPVTGTLRTR